MANYCSNSVQFDCDEKTLKKIKRLFNDMAAKEGDEKIGQLPDFIQADKGHMTDIFWHNDTLNYETRWCPNIEVMQAIADYFKVGFNYSYEEISNLIYGYAEYKHGVLTDLSLDLSELEAYTYDEKKDVYLFEGVEYDNDYKILKILLRRKKQEIAKINFIKN